MAYGVSTSVACVNQEGNLIEKDLTTKKTRVLLTLAVENAVISKFRVRYANTPALTRLSKDLFLDFPHGDSSKAQCINLALVEIAADPKNPKTALKSETFERTILLNNFNSRRPAACTTP